MDKYVRFNSILLQLHRCVIYDVFIPVAPSVSTFPCLSIAFRIRQLNEAVLRTRPQNPNSCVTTGVAR